MMYLRFLYIYLVILRAPLSCTSGIGKIRLQMPQNLISPYTGQWSLTTTCFRS